MEKEGTNADTTETTRPDNMDTSEAAAAGQTNSTQLPVESHSKTLKRCLSVPVLKLISGCAPLAAPNASRPMTLRSAAAKAKVGISEPILRTPHKYRGQTNTETSNNVDKSVFIRSNPSSRECSPAPLYFSHRRRYSSNSSLLSVINSTATSLCVTPRVSQLRKEECTDIAVREINHEREVRTALQISQSYEDLTLSAESWSCKSEDFSNTLRISTPPALSLCLSPSPSPTGQRASLRLPYSPSPTRRTYATRRSMSPVPMRPSQLTAVKRKFELEDNSSNWNVCSQPPLKKMMTESRGSSPSYHSSTSNCASPDPLTHDGRATPKLFISKLCNPNTVNSECSSPVSVSSSTQSSLLSGSSQNTDEGISLSDLELKLRSRSSSTISVTSCLTQQVQSTDISDDATLMDDIKSETSSVSGCSTVSYESSVSENNTKAGTTFLNRLASDDGIKNNGNNNQKSFFINRHGLRGAKKFIVNHKNLPNNNNNNNGSE